MPAAAMINLTHGVRASSAAGNNGEQQPYYQQQPYQQQQHGDHRSDRRKPTAVVQPLDSTAEGTQKRWGPKTRNKNQAGGATAAVPAPAALPPDPKNLPVPTVLLRGSGRGAANNARRPPPPPRQQQQQQTASGGANMAALWSNMEAPATGGATAAPSLDDLSSNLKTMLNLKKGDTATRPAPPTHPPPPAAASSVQQFFAAASNNSQARPPPTAANSSCMALANMISDQGIPRYTFTEAPGEFYARLSTPWGQHFEPDAPQPTRDMAAEAAAAMALKALSQNQSDHHREREQRQEARGGGGGRGRGRGGHNKPQFVPMQVSKRMATSGPPSGNQQQQQQQPEQSPKPKHNPQPTRGHGRGGGHDSARVEQWLQDSNGQQQQQQQQQQRGGGAQRGGGRGGERGRGGRGKRRPRLAANFGDKLQ